MKNLDVIKQIERLCGKTVLLENGWNHFVYKDIQYVYIPNYKNDMIRISIPHICKVDEYERNNLERIINETNKTVKFIKIYVLDNGSISINYDHKICVGENFNDIVTHIIETLYSASEYFMLKLRIL